MPIDVMTGKLVKSRRQKQKEKRPRTAPYLDSQLLQPKVEPVTKQELLDAGVTNDLCLTASTQSTQQSYCRTTAYKSYIQNNGKPFDKAVDNALDNPQGNYQK